MTAVDRYGDMLARLDAENLAELAEYLSADVRFKDPFQEVFGRAAMLAVFAHMFEAVGPVRFIVHDRFGDARRGVLVWRFEARLRARPWAFEGTSVLTFAADGRVSAHVDHWDAAGDFYEHLPVIGWPLAWARRRIASHSNGPDRQRSPRSS